MIICNMRYKIRDEIKGDTIKRDFLVWFYFRRGTSKVLLINIGEVHLSRGICCCHVLMWLVECGAHAGRRLCWGVFQCIQSIHLIFLYSQQLYFFIYLFKQLSKKDFHEILIYIRLFGDKYCAD